MVITVTGGSGSGKSEYAEKRLVSLREQWAGEEHVPDSHYIATMYPFDAESKLRVLKHQKMRADRDFHTIECFTKLQELELPGHPFLLLECMSNLVANENYMECGCRLQGESFVDYIMEGVKHCIAQASHMVIVTNEVQSDGIDYDQDTKAYMKLLGCVNQRLSSLSDEVIEVVYGIPVRLK